MNSSLGIEEHLLHSLFIAQIGGSDLLESQLSASQDIAQLWDEQWNFFMGGDLYAALTEVGVLFAVGTLLMMMTVFAKQMLQDGVIGQPLEMMIWPLLVTVLLANEGMILSNATLSLRNVINGVNEQVLSITQEGTEIRETYRQAIGYAALEDWAGQILAQCQSLKTTEEQRACLEEQYETVRREVEATSLFDGVPVVGTFLDRLGRAINTAGPLGLVSAVQGSSNTARVKMMFLGFQWGFSNLLEASMLLTGLLGPLAVGGSLLPVGPGGKAVVAWLTGFFSIAIAKLSFNILAGICAGLIVNSDPQDTMWFLTIVGFLAPVLALGLAAGGGMAIFRSLTSAASRVVGVGLSVGRML
jgi:hypothetical protein